MSRGKPRSKPKKKAKPPPAKVSPRSASPEDVRRFVTERVSFIASCVYFDLPDPWLDWDPNDEDVDPSMFYQAVKETFRLAPPPNAHASFDGLGGPIRALIDAVVARWQPPYELDPPGPI